MLKTDSAVMRSIDAVDTGIGGKKQKYDFPDTLEGFKYAFNDSTIYLFFKWINWSDIYSIQSSSVHVSMF